MIRSQRFMHAKALTKADGQTKFAMFYYVLIASVLVQEWYFWALSLQAPWYFLLLLAHSFSSLSKFVTMFIAKWKSITRALKKKKEIALYAEIEGQGILCICAAFKTTWQ